MIQQIGIFLIHFIHKLGCYLKNIMEFVQYGMMANSSQKHWMQYLYLYSLNKKCLSVTLMVFFGEKLFILTLRLGYDKLVNCQDMIKSENSIHWKEAKLFLVLVRIWWFL